MHLTATTPPDSEHWPTVRSRQYRRPRQRQRNAKMEIEVIAWDGEGFDEDGRHRYALLASSLGTELRDRNGLRSFRILDHVWKIGRSRREALHVVYGAQYDFDWWVHDLNLESARALKKGHPVAIGPYTVRHNGVWFELTRENHTVQVWDVWKFWQQPFKDALAGSFPNFDALPLIEKFKEARGRFSWDIIDEVSEYNKAELRGLVMMMHQLFTDLEVADIPAPAYLTGAGALAGALLRKHGVNRHVGDQTYGSAEVEEAVLRSFAAGRADSWMIGHHEGPCYQHDLRSAYPTAMQDLPSLAEGEWVWRETLSDDWDDRFSTWLVRWNYVPGLTGESYPEPPTRRYFPFFFRTRQGSILFPPSGMGWQWWPEVITARELGWPFEVIGGWVWEPAHPEVRPFSWVPRLYKQRAALKADGREGAQRVLKYGLNALYGKLAQARGYTADNRPKLQQLAWAGWVTSATRARIMEAAHQAPDQVVYQMTDSVMSLVRLDVAEGSYLGEWEIEECERALVAQAGVGSLWKKGKEVPKYRGFDPETISAKAILDAWKENHDLGWMHPLQTQVRRPIMLSTAIESEKRFAQWGEWLDSPRDLHIYGGDGKRVGSVFQSMKPWERMCELDPAPLAFDEHGNALSWNDWAEFCAAKDWDPMSACYSPKYESTDPWSLPEVRGKLDRINDDMEAKEHQ